MMAKLIYSAIASADGYIEDPGGGIDWGMPDEELLGFINELEQPARTCLYGRRMYEAMLYWETARTTVQRRLFREFTGIWQAAGKIVFSKTPIGVEREDTGRAGLRARPGPAAEAGRRA
jgi:dihydrofolate reductase